MGLLDKMKATLRPEPPPLIPPDTITIEITNDDIANGAKASVRGCPAALGLARAVPDHTTDSFVGLDTAWVMLEGGYRWEMYGNPALPEFIRAYDAGENVRPTTFVLHHRAQRTS